ncbi:MAG: fibronectin type III domain-containing protein [Algibacter sp.]
MKQIIKLILLFICSLSFSQTNLIDTSSWLEGAGSVSGFSKKGSDGENIRELGIGPHGNSVLLWKTIPEATGTSGAGGWETDYINIDPSKTYRFTLWVKKTNSFDGSTYFRAYGKDDSGNTTVNYLSGSPISNPYFLIKDSPTLDTWYLWVGYMHKNAYTSTTSIGGVYSADTGVKMLDCTDFKFQTIATKIKQSIWLASNNNASDRQFYYGPTMYEVNGSEPSIQDLINAHPDGQIPSKPTLSTTVQTDTTIDLSWTAATDNIGVIGYNIFKNGVLETTLGNILNYQVTGLTASTAYTFTATAFDASNNHSIDSNVLNITTNSTPIPATNLLDTSTWSEGSGSVAGFSQYGVDEENIREIGIGPYGANVLLWKAVPNESNGTAGGWGTGYFSIDHTKTYRFTIWIKKINSNDGYTEFAFSALDSSGENAYSFLNGDPHNNSSFYRGDPPGLDEWYLFSGYIHKSTYTNTNSIGGVYNKSGVKLSILNDYKFLPEVLELQQRVWLAGDTNTSDAQFFYAPTLYEVNGQEPTIEELINAQPIDIQNPTNTNTGYWSLNNDDVYYNGGRVGIGTDTPDEKLAVNGNIHTKEIRVDLNDWPDYVFTNKHQLPTLKEVENHIKENGHLPNIPSAKDVKENGLLLGDMNAKLLEKIEELTLYIIQMEKRLNKLEK